MTINVVAEAAGLVQEVVAIVGADVAEGDTLLILESMKMEIPIDAPRSGKIIVVCAVVGEAVNAGDVLFQIDEFAR